ncbi:TetR/AcrR family transcriptional regulator [Alicycliphilus sp. T452]
MPQPIPPACGAAAAPARRRLAPQVRIAQILDAALVEFSERGFAATTMDDIGRRCGLSKGGLYAHFASKDEIFEALLHRSLAPPEWQEPPVVPPIEAGTRAFAQWLVDRLYAGLLERPAAVVTLRLLAAERGRVKDLVELWEHNVVRPNMALLADMLRTHAARLGLPPSVIVREPWLVIAPVMYALLTQMILDHEPAVGLECLRGSHVELLCELLDPRERIAGAVSGGACGSGV